jgi:hypothetical protein
MRDRPVEEVLSTTLDALRNELTAGQQFSIRPSPFEYPEPVKSNLSYWLIIAFVAFPLAYILINILGLLWGFGLLLVALLVFLFLYRSYYSIIFMLKYRLWYPILFGPRPIF